MSRQASSLTSSISSGTGTRHTRFGMSPDVLLALITIYIVWGSTYLGIRLALVSFPPFLLISTRFLAAGVVLFVLALARRERLPTKVQWRNSAIVGGLLLGGGVGMTAFAEQYIPSSMSATIIASAPIWNVLAAGIFGLWPRRLEWLGIAVGFVGVVLLSFDGNLRAQPIGLIAQLVGITCWALGSAFGRKLQLPHGNMGNAAEMLCGGVILMGMSLARGEGVPTSFQPQAVAAWLYLVTFGSLLAYSAYMHVLKHLRPAMASSYAYVNPIVAIVLGAVIAAEPITPLMLIAMGVILGGVVIMSIVQARQNAEAKTQG